MSCGFNARSPRFLDSFLICASVQGSRRVIPTYCKVVLPVIKVLFHYFMIPEFLRFTCRLPPTPTSLLRPSLTVRAHPLFLPSPPTRCSWPAHPPAGP